MENGTLYGKKNFANEIKLKILKWKKVAWIIRVGAT